MRVLLRDRDVPSDAHARLIGRIVAHEQGTRMIKGYSTRQGDAGARQIIDWLKGRPFKAQSPAPSPSSRPADSWRLFHSDTPAAEGIYETPCHRVFSVVTSTDGTFTYAKEFVPSTGSGRVNLADERVQVKLVKARGWQFHLSPDWRVSPERAAELSFKFRLCVRCGARMEAAETLDRIRQSPEQAWGPVCAHVILHGHRPRKGCYGPQFPAHCHQGERRGRRPAADPTLVIPPPTDAHEEPDFSDTANHYSSTEDPDGF
jgi:hypothetical protein